ncbi:NADPH-dependent FMN reductase [Oryzibacter oryziterrae]|uniref:NADPH-dependent FMN reductase n=1 Tax=Oryzibacter oryziterrae TaxID=2766474 RepID=UPI001F36D6F1|nr:NAD(P)H-dependent oxidoreductase [Oryzibacter oryziterrae]
MARARPRILTLAGSARGQSFNAALAAYVTKAIALRDADVRQISLADYPLPLYDGDLEAAEGVPDNARKLVELFTGHNGIFIAAPEYNQSITPLLKNTLDWMSRLKPESPRSPSPWKGRVFALGSASPGYYGGSRALVHLRQVMELGLGCRVLTDQLVLPSVGSAFDASGEPTNERLTRQVEALAEALIEEAAHFVL